MQRENLESEIEKGETIRGMAIKFGCSPSTIKHWMKKYNLKTENSPSPRVSEFRVCPGCKTNKPRSEFYKRRGIKGRSVYCKPCTTKQVVERQRAFKVQCVDYMGGECSKCGYSRHPSALEFHHLDPTQKDFTIARVRLNKLNAEIKKELDKCVILCSNCHREEHARIGGW